MRTFVKVACVLAALSAPTAMAADRDIAPGGTLRAAYLGTNPAQAVKDRVSGVLRGASADLARELGRRIGMPVEFKPLERDDF